MITIIARPTYIGNPYKMKEHSAQRLSSRIRCDEIAPYIGAKVVYYRGRGEGTVIHVKPMGLNHIKDGEWIDYLDGGRFHDQIKGRPGINIIAASEHSADTLRSELPNKIVVIPHQHINHERKLRERKEVSVAGYTGSPSPVAVRIYGEIAEAVKPLGFDFKTCFDFKTREDAMGFYSSIDVMVVGAWELGDPGPHKMPTKLINAMSFGIPVLAYRLDGYREIEGYYTNIGNMDDLRREIVKFKDPEYYKYWSERGLELAEKYHIENVAKRYHHLLLV